MRYYLTDSNARAVNLIEWDGVTPYTPPDGCALVPEAQFTPPAPTPATGPRAMTPLEFLNRIPVDAQLRVSQAVKANAAAELWWFKLIAATEVDLDNPDTIAGVGFMLAAGVISQAEAAALLA